MAPPHRLVVAAMWLLASVALVAMLAQGVRETDGFGAGRHALHAAYVAALLWHLGRTGPSFERLPELPPLLLRRWEIGRLIPAVGVGLLVALSLLSDDGDDLVMLFMMVATLWMLAAWWREIRWRAAVVGLAAGAVALLAGLPAWKNGMISTTAVILLAAFVPPMFLAGGLLIERSRLGASRLHARRYGGACASFLRGCLLFVPLGLVNAADGSPGDAAGWVSEWWMPVSLPFFSGIAEEAWFRLLLVGLFYFLLRPAFRQAPTAAVGCAIVFSAVVFGLGHGRTLDRLLTTGLLYGLPMAVVFTKRDWEHAVGAHYMINMIPWGMAFLES